MSKISEFKRVSLTTISHTVTTSLPSGVTSDAASFRFGADFMAATQNKQNSGSGIGSGGSEKKPVHRTIRLELELFQTDSSAYPEFNYTKLINLETKKLKKTKEKVNGFSDPFEENDDDVTRIAKELEKKYGNSYGKARSKKDDFCDIGMGYDESDSFIDNTEAYDEVVPAEVETIEGGFYINCGALEFKSLRPEKPPKTRTDDIIKMPERIRKRILSSSSGSDDSESSEESDEDENDEDNSEDSEDDEDDESSDESSIKTSKSKDSYASAEKNGKAAIVANDKETKSIVLTTSSSSTSPKPTAFDNNSENETKQRFNAIKTTTVKDMLKAKRDKFLKARVEREPSAIPNGNELRSATSAKSSENESSSDDSSESEDDSNASIDEAAPEKTTDKKPTTTSTTTTSSKDKDSEKLRSADTQLPKLDEDVASNIFQFKELVKTQNWIGKKFHFNDSLTQLFLKIDEALMCIDKPQRNMVFAHLEFQLMLPKYYFLRKAKQLRIKEEKLKVSSALTKLSTAIAEIMPGAIANYEVDLRKFADMQSALLTTTDQPPKMPRKKFPWTNNLRNLLYEVYQVRWTSYPVLGTRKETLEEFINGFLRSKVVEIWPSGWMRYEEIQKEIEKRKNAVKKAKEKERQKKELNAITNHPANIVAPLIISDTDSNLATNAEQEKPPSNSLKRKNSDASQKLNKNKTLKLSSNPLNKQNKVVKQQIAQQLQQQQLQTPQMLIDVVLDLCSPTKRAENNLKLANAVSLGSAGGNVNTLQSTTALNSPANSSVQTLNPIKTQMATHVIDLDNYTSTSDILKTTKQLAAARVAAQPIPAETSDEDNAVEFVGIFPAKTSATTSPNNYKQKTKKSQTNNSNNRVASNVTHSPLSSLQMEPPNFYAAKANSNNNCEYDVAQMMKHMEDIKRSIANQQNSPKTPTVTTAAAAAALAAAQLNQLNSQKVGRDAMNQ